MAYCGKCGAKLKENADVCIECGSLVNQNKIQPTKKRPRKSIQVINGILIVIAIALICYLISSCVSINVGVDTNLQNKNINKEKFSYTVTSSAPDDFNFAYYIQGVVTNDSYKDYSYVQIEFICYDTDGNNIGTAIDNTANLLGKETWKYKAIGMFTDEKVDHCDYKEITSW